MRLYPRPGSGDQTWGQLRKAAETSLCCATGMSDGMLSTWLARTSSSYLIQGEVDEPLSTLFTLIYVVILPKRGG